jgi:hypothetical protein
MGIWTLSDAADRDGPVLSIMESCSTGLGSKPAIICRLADPAALHKVDELIGQLLLCHKRVNVREPDLANIPIYAVRQREKISLKSFHKSILALSLPWCDGSRIR